MAVYYAKSTCGFYMTEIHGSDIPPDAVEITHDEHIALLTAQSAGKVISAEEAGKPQAIDRVFSVEETAAILKDQAKTALAQSDLAILRCYENGVAVPAGWQSYRAALRMIVSGYEAEALPTRPDYPAGT